MLIGWYYLRYMNIFVINARKQRPVKCLDKHNFRSFSIMDLHSLIIYHIIKLFLKLNRMSGINSSLGKNRQSKIYFFSYNSFKKIKKVIDNSSKVLYYYTTASEVDKFLKQKQNFWNI